MIACLCLREGFIPANLNLERLDPEFQSNVQRHAVEQPLTRVLSNSFGFGGSNCSVILGRVCLMELFVLGIGVLGPGLGDWPQSRAILRGPKALCCPGP